MRSALLALGVLLLATPRIARADVDVQPLPCPVDGDDVDVTILLSTDSLLGHDRDLCPHAAGDDEIPSAVSSCPRCGFSGTADEFKAGLPDDVVAKIKSDLPPPKGPLSPSERYANRAQILAWEGAPDAVIGESWLRAAWSVRLEPRQIADPDLAASAKKILGAVPLHDGEDKILGPADTIETALLSKKSPSFVIAPEDRATAWYLVASDWRLRGEFAAAEQRYARAEQEAKISKHEGALGDLIARDRASIELEKSYLTRALDRFESALKDPSKIAPGERAMAAFLAAESARRLGKNDEAARFYKSAQAVAGDSSEPELKALVKQGLADVKKK